MVLRDVVLLVISTTMITLQEILTRLALLIFSSGNGRHRDEHRGSQGNTHTREPSPPQGIKAVTSEWEAAVWWVVPINNLGQTRITQFLSSVSYVG